MKLTTRSIVVAGILIALVLLLGLTRIAYFPVPNLTGEATILHVAPILGGVLEGPIVGAIVGAVFGITTYFLPSVQPLFAGQPIYVPIIVLVLPRILIGVVAWLVYRSLRNMSQLVATILAGVLGALTSYALFAWLSNAWPQVWASTVAFGVGGLTASFLTYAAFRWRMEIIALGAAAVAGAATNTVLVLWLAISFGLLDNTIWAFAAPQAVFEAVVAAVVTVLVVSAYKGLARERQGSTV